MGAFDKSFRESLLVILLENLSIENGALCRVRKIGQTQRHKIKWHLATPAMTAAFDLEKRPSCYFTQKLLNFEASEVK